MLGDIIVIGGGASGMTAAIAAKTCRPDVSVTICERLDRVGKKILSTGNGRCNLSNRSLKRSNYHGSVDALGVIEAEPSADEFFAGAGLVLTSDEAGRVYPYSNSAASVLSALRLKMQALGITEECGFEVSGISRIPGGYSVVSTDGIKLSAKRLIVAAGGCAAPSAGTDGAVLRMFRDMGYETAKLFPAVAPLRTFPEDVKGLKGVRARCRVTAVAGGKKLRSEAGEIQFTENSLSGICVFNLAYLISAHSSGLELHVDFAPDMPQSSIEEYLLSVKEQRAGSGCEELLTGIFGKNLALFLTKKALRKPLTEPVSKLCSREIKVLAGLVKECPFRVSGAAPWQSAQSTLGGITAQETGSDLSSRRDRGIYFCGEILDTAGDCGGYNLQWAWSSGWRAGRNCALSLKG